MSAQQLALPRHGSRFANERQEVGPELRASLICRQPPRLFTELQNAQAVVLPYDGLNPLPPQFCYLKPYYLDARQSYFDHLERGAL